MTRQSAESYPGEINVEVREDENTAGKIGYIDRTGRMVIQPQFELGGVESDYPFSEGLAAVAVAHGKWGYIDKTGKFAIAPRFQELFPSRKGAQSPALLSLTRARRCTDLLTSKGDGSSTHGTRE